MLRSQTKKNKKGFVGRRFPTTSSNHILLSSLNCFKNFFLEFVTLKCHIKEEIFIAEQ